MVETVSLVAENCYSRPPFCRVLYVCCYCIVISMCPMPLISFSVLPCLSLYIVPACILGPLLSHLGWWDMLFFNVTTLRGVWVWGAKVTTQQNTPVMLPAKHILHLLDVTHVYISAFILSVFCSC